MQRENFEETKHDLNELLALLISQLVRTTGAEQVLIYLYDSGDEMLWNRSGVGAEIMEVQYKIGQGIPGKVIEEGKLINIEDAKRDSRFNLELDRVMGIDVKTMLVVPIIDTEQRKVGVIQLINKKEAPFTERDIQFVEAMAAQAAIAIENTVLYLNLQETRKREEGLNEEIREQSLKLKDAYIQLDEKSRLIERSSKKVLRNRTIITIASIILFVIVGYFLWGSAKIHLTKVPKPVEEKLPVITEENKGTIPVYIVKTEPLYFPLTLSGNLDAVETENLFAPFTGRITEVNFKIGESVQKDQVLLKIDTEQLEADYRSAQIEEWKAKNEYEEIKDWDKSVEMAKAKRALARAKDELADKRRTMEKSMALHKEGIIPDNEWEGIQKAVKEGETSLIAAQEEYDGVLKRGDEQSVKIKLFAFQNAELKERDFKDKLDKATIFSPVYGVAIKPASATESESSRGSRREVTVEKGVKIDEGSIFVGIADMTRLSVLGRVDELDITKVKAGQDVNVTGDAFPGIILRGKVDYVSSQAKTGGTKPYFEIRVTTVPLTKEQLDAVRLGMTATLSVMTYVNPKAILIPFNTIQTDFEGNYVYRLPEGSTVPEKVRIERGITTVRAVEVTSGLEAGDRLLYNP